MATQTDVASIPLVMLAAQPLLLACVHGFSPCGAAARGTASEQHVQPGMGRNLRPYLSGVKRGGMLALALPVLVALFAWHSAVLGLRVAVLHFCTGGAFVALIMEVLFLRYRRIPFVGGYVPSTDLKSRGAVYAAAGVLVCETFAHGLSTINPGVPRPTS